MNNAKRILAWALGGVATMLSSILMLGQTSSGLATELAVYAHSESSSVSPAIALRKKKHRGERAKDGWHSCKDDNTTVRTLKMPATLSADEKKVEWNPQNANQLGKVYDAAFQECFMEDLDNLPGYGPFAPQHDGRDYTIDGEIVTLLLRPASNIALSKFNDLQAGEGFIAADVHNSSETTTFHTDDFEGEIQPLHSAIYWLGKDNSGKPYVAVVDLGQFPEKTQPASKRDFLVMDGGGLDVNSKNANRTDIGIARWYHKDKNESNLIHEGSWVDCDPGCCMSKGEVAIFSLTAKRIKPSAHSITRPGAPLKRKKKP
ncbi:MAG: hypothetical protein JWM95_1618 [Gemmatimonadetes bacterium]|nr:hypothetical protein [Gemmatimonadota bacterium]